MKKFFLYLTLALTATTSFAQRVTDKLDRGVVAMKAAAGKGVYVNWRINADEYYDVKYNVYRDGTKINGEPLDVSNFTDEEGTISSKYTVSAVVRGKEQEQSKAATVWGSSYKEIKLTHKDIASKLIPNDACCADVDGDGEVEILMKFDNESEMVQSYPKNGPTVNGKVTGEYSIFEIFKQNGNRLWWVNCGPNMGDFQNNEQNIVGYDWNMDGKAEVIMRLEEGSSIHMADGTVYTIGANGKNGGAWTNYRAATGGGTNWFMCVGKEFLVYCDGETGQVLDIIDYPLARLEPGESDLNKAWGDGYGHRASKFFFGAPYLDGKHPSIFLARGIYTQIKMCAFDVDVATNKLVKRWDWRQTNGGFWMWQGYHNFGIADVDEDGRDEIVYGSMVVDDNGKGLSTTGLGHGDAQHCGDFNPYTKGLEIYACNEDQPGNNYRDATTSKIYHRFNSGNDDGRAMMDNFTDAFPGSIGCSAREGAISSVTYGAVSGMDATGINTNFRIYWDGDLCSETFNYQNGKNTAGVVAKYGSWSPIYVCEGSMTNNDTKGTPCYQGDILGDWREEIIMRTANGNIRIYSTPTPTDYRIPSLWTDHQYRNAMVWQMCGYNQPPHVSYFVGKLEGITQAPPPLTMNGREEVANGSIIDSKYDDKHAIVCETNDTKVSLANGAKPHVLTFNVPSWVQGTAGTNYTAKDSKITYKYYTCDVTDGYLDGDASLVKQGDGILNLPKSEFKHSGETNIWAGVLNFDGKLTNSPLWLNRFTELNSNGGEFKSIKTSYASIIRPGGENTLGNITTGELELGFGSRIKIDLFSNDQKADQIITKSLKIEAKTEKPWTNAGPKYLKPIIELVGHFAEGETKMAPGKYVIGTVEDGNIEGDINNIIIEGLSTTKKKLYVEGNKLIVEIFGLRDATSVIWTGTTNNIWDLAETENFVLADPSAEATVFVSGDNILFNDDANSRTVSIKDNLIPATIEINNSKDKSYTFNGSGSIAGNTKFVKEGEGAVTISGNNSYTGGNELKGGTVKVNLLSNQYSAVGNLGGISAAGKFTMENGATLQTSGNVRQGSPMKMIGTEGGVINNSGEFVMDAAFTGTVLTKKGSGALKSGVAGSLSKLIVAGGIVDASQKLANSIEVQSNADLRGNAFLSTPIFVADKAKANLTTINRATTNLALTGTGQITIWCATEKGSNYYATRTPIALNLKNFEGTIVPEATYAADGRFTFDTQNGGDKWTLNIPSGRFVQNTGKTLRIGQVTGTGELGGSCTFSNNSSNPANTWQVGNDKDFKFEGKVVGADKFSKMGTGKMTTNGVWSTSGAVNVNDGELHFNSGSTLGKGTLTVDKNGLLSGTSKSGVPMTNSIFNINGTLLPGASSTLATGSINFNGKNVNFGQESTLRIGLRKANTAEGVLGGSGIENVNTLKFAAGAKISVYLYEKFIPSVGDEIRVFANVKSISGTPIVVCDTEGVEFDTSKLSEGILIVTKADIVDAIASIAPADNVIVEVVSTNGIAVDRYNSTMNSAVADFKKRNMNKGIYILRITSCNNNGKAQLKVIR